MKIALAQINPTVGDLRGNSGKIVEFTRRAEQQGADLVVFPELCITGYPPLDLLENDRFIDAASDSAAWIAARVSRSIGVILGLPERNTETRGKPLFNTAALLEGGAIRARAHKTLLPTYDVFDEFRYFQPGRARNVVPFRGLRLGLHVCEDMWSNAEQRVYHAYDQHPVDELASAGADLLINISASPFSLGKHRERNAIIEAICRKHSLPFILVNQVGSNTEIVFDGDSRVHDRSGSLIAFARSFDEDLILHELHHGESSEPVERDRADIEDLHDALVLGIRDYFHKTGFFSKAVLGLSGGIDSAVTCALAVAALGAQRVEGVTMPSRFSSEGSVGDSRALAANLGIRIHEIEIEPAVKAFESMLEPRFSGTDRGVAEENIQARSRGVTLMALSNKFGYLLLSTGNKSEMAVGYATLYGDMNGGLAVLADVYKTQVYALALHINERAGREIIPRNTIEKPPSAELRPNQTDQDSLPPYVVLDAILKAYIEEGRETQDIIAGSGFEPDVVLDVLRKVDQNEYKRRQAPPGLRVSGRAFGIGRRMPIVMRWEREVNQS